MSGSGDALLVVDVGTSGVRAAVVLPDGLVAHVHHRSVLPDTPAPGLVEIDADRMAGAVLELARQVLAEAGPVAGVGIANQRATTVVWDRKSGRPVAPAIGWQDLRTVGTCLTLQAEGLRLAPNASATKVAAILDAVDPERRRAEAGELCFGTVDSWVAWVLSGGPDGAALHVTDATNAGVTAMVRPDAGGWDPRVLEPLGIPDAMLPAIVDSSGVVGEAAALEGSPPICGLAGDQQASLVGQGCLRPGQAKATFGTGGMLDLCTGETRPAATGRGEAGTFPIVAYRRRGVTRWGVEAMMLSAGSCVEWLRDDLGIISSAEQSGELAAGCPDAGDVWFVPALLGLGTPVWDFGARGTLLGLTRGTGRAHLARAVLEGVAHRGADLVEAAEADSGFEVPSLRVDGGVSANEVFVAALAEATGRPVLVSSELEATTLGAGLLAGMATGTWRDEDEVAATYRPRLIVEPTLDETARARRRERWLEARARAEQTIPELSGISF